VSRGLTSHSTLYRSFHAVSALLLLFSVIVWKHSYFAMPLLSRRFLYPLRYTNSYEWVIVWTDWWRWLTVEDRQTYRQTYHIAGTSVAIVRQNTDVDDVAEWRRTDCSGWKFSDGVYDDVTFDLQQLSYSSCSCHYTSHPLRLSVSLPVYQYLCWSASLSVRMCVFFKCVSAMPALLRHAS